MLIEIKQMVNKLNVISTNQHGRRNLLHYKSLNWRELEIYSNIAGLNFLNSPLERGR
jgi:hypothetical protein